MKPRYAPEPKAQDDEANLFNGEDAKEVIQEGSVGPGRGTKLRALPKVNLFNVLTRDQCEAIIRWARKHVRCDGLDSDAEQSIREAFARTAVAAGLTRAEVYTKARTVAKRWALEEKRLLGYAVILSKDEAKIKENRESAGRVDPETGSEYLVDQHQNEDAVDPDFEADYGSEVDWSKMPPKYRDAIDKVWPSLHFRVTRVMRHVLMGETVRKAAVLEGVTESTAIERLTEFRKAIAAHP